MECCWAGIDVGVNGAIARIGDDGSIWAQVVPVIVPAKGKTQYNEIEMAKILRGLKASGVVCIAIEEVQAMPEQGRSSIFNFGVGFGLWRGMIAMAGISMQRVPPQRWQKAMLLGIPSGDTKARALQAAQHLFPEIDLRANERCKKPHDGIVDALLLAEWCRRMVPAITRSKV